MPESGSTRVPISLRRRRALIFAVSTVLLTYLAVRGGAYDAVVRQEYGLVLSAALAFGLLLGVLPRAQIQVLNVVPLAGLVALALLTFLNFFSSATDERTLTEFARVSMFAGAMALPILVLNRYTWRAAAGGIAVATVGVAAYAVATRLVPDALGNDSVLAGDRLSYPLDYWNGMGAWGAASVVIGLAWSAHSKVNWTRALALASLPVSFLCIYLSYSRGGWAAVALGALAVIVLGRNRWTTLIHLFAGAAGAAVAVAVTRSQPEIVHATGGSGGAAVVIVLIAVAVVCAGVAYATLATGLDRTQLPRTLVRWVVPTATLLSVAVFFAAGGADLIEKGWDEFNGDTAPVLGADPAERLQTAATTRSEVWDRALDAASDEPLGGIGPGNFENYWAQHSPTQEYMRDAHSLYIEQLAELGVPGLVAVLVAVIGGLALAIRARFRMTRSVDIGPATAMIATGLVFAITAASDWMWELTAVTILGLSAIAVVMASDAERIRRFGIRPLMRAGIVGIALLAAISQIPGLVSTSRERQSTDLLADGSTSGALELADDAVDAEPWGSTPYLQRAAVEVVDGDLDAAESDVQDAIDRDPEAWRPWFALVQVDGARGDDTAAERAFDRLRKYSLSSAVPFQTVEQLADFEPLTDQFRRGCLAMTIGDCF